MKTHEGKLTAQGLKIGLVVARFNEFVTQRLLDGAVDAFRRHGGDPDSLEIAWVPGAFELPLAANALARTKRFQGLVVLGAVIRGDTPHFDYVAGAAAQGLARVGADFSLPVGFGLLTTETVEQAIDRAGSKAGNKGAEAMATTIEMIHLLREIGG
ncbi:MAG: 6,7-dimethyl-8-ribityllumazine synthase [Deltaproteobacteria bacterium]|nr:6,7-dimethyl-8-ribityllumazine synthase [Deltaproteobacteria bacterium]